MSATEAQKGGKTKMAPSRGEASLAKGLETLSSVPLESFLSSISTTGGCEQSPLKLGNAAA